MSLENNYLLYSMKLNFSLYKFKIDFPLKVPYNIFKTPDIWVTQ